MRHASECVSHGSLQKNDQRNSLILGIALITTKIVFVCTLLSRLIFSVFSFWDVSVLGRPMRSASALGFWRSLILDYERWARSWARFLGSQPADDSVINPAVGWCYFPPGSRLLSQPKRSPPGRYQIIYCLVLRFYTGPVIYSFLFILFFFVSYPRNSLNKQNFPHVQKWARFQTACSKFGMYSPKNWGPKLPITPCSDALLSYEHWQRESLATSQIYG